MASSVSVLTGCKHWKGFHSCQEHRGGRKFAHIPGSPVLIIRANTRIYKATNFPRELSYQTTHNLVLSHYGNTHLAWGLSENGGSLSGANHCFRISSAVCATCGIKKYDEKICWFNLQLKIVHYGLH